MTSDKIKFQYISDLHLDFQSNQDFLKRYPIKPVGEVLLIAGDFATLQYSEKQGITYPDFTSEFLDYFSKNWKYTILIPGNHEYYGEEAPCVSSCTRLNIPLRKNVYLINNTCLYFSKNKKGGIEICNGITSKADYKIFGTTLWSFIPYEYYIDIKNGLNDYNFGSW